MIKTKKCIILIITLISFLFVMIGCSYSDEGSHSVNTVPTKETVSFVAAGDALIHAAIYRQARERSTDGGYDFTYTFQHTQHYFEDFDVKFINQETLVNDVFEPSHYPSFSSPTAFGDHLVEMGFNVIGTSNNHMYDKGEAGVAACLDYWNSQDILHVGFYTGDDSKDIKYLTKNDITIAFLAYTESTNDLSVDKSVSPYVITFREMDTIERQVRTARELADVVVVSCHWGEEDSNSISEMQKNTAKKLCQMGVDVIIGTHPHVIQPVQWLVDETTNHKTLVAYSLGNFISAQFRVNNMLGGLLQFNIEKKIHDDGSYKVSITEPYFVPIITHYETADANNITNYLLADYTPDIAQTHGVAELRDNFSLEYMIEIARTVIDEKFLLFDSAY